MQIISTIPLCNYEVPVITTTKNFTFCPGKSRENFPNFFQDFPGLINKIQGLLRIFQDRKKNPGLFQDVATLKADESMRSRASLKRRGRMKFLSGP